MAAPPSPLVLCSLCLTGQSYLPLSVCKPLNNCIVFVLFNEVIITFLVSCALSRTFLFCFWSLSIKNCISITIAIRVSETYLIVLCAAVTCLHYITLYYSVHHRLNGSSSPVLTATSRSYGKTKNSTPDRIETPNLIEIKFGTVDDPWCKI